MEVYVFIISVKILLRFLPFYNNRKRMLPIGNNVVQLMPSTAPVSSQIIRKTTFDVTISDREYFDCLCFLLDNYIILKIKNNDDFINFKVKLNFDLLFQVEYEKQGEHFKGINFIRLERQGDQIYIRSPKNPKQLTAWRDYFDKTLHQKGFHQLFTAYKKIGKGNFASVYLVQKKQDKKPYAVKAFSKESLYAQQKGKNSLINQIQIMKKFNHKNLMKLFGVYQTDNSIYVVVELLQGGILSDKMKKQIRLTTLEIKLIMKGILEGLQAMHKKQIMHRDIKPQNILFRKQNDLSCVIADFGLAEHVNSVQYLFARCGTPGFVAPQIANLKDHNAKYTSACDLFSVGIIFHMLLLRESPFPGKQYNQVLKQNRACHFTFHSYQYQQLPESNLDLLTKLLQVDPSKRITASEALKHPFFINEFTFWENSNRNSLKVQSKFLNSNVTSNTTPSKTKMTEQNKTEPKVQRRLREDSCLKFTMKENLLTGKSEGESVSLNSPQFGKKITEPSSKAKANEKLSRFAKN